MQYAITQRSFGDKLLIRIVMAARSLSLLVKNRFRKRNNKMLRLRQTIGTIHVPFWVAQRIAKVKHNGAVAERL